MSTIGFDTGPQQVRTALLSVSDKTGSLPYTRLRTLDIQLLSTGTSRRPAAGRIRCDDVSQVTGFPEIMMGA